MLNITPLIAFIFFFKIFFITSLYFLVFRVLTFLYCIDLNFQEIVHISVSEANVSEFFNESGSFTLSQLIPFFLLDHPANLKASFSLLSFIMVEFSVSDLVFLCAAILYYIVCKIYAPCLKKISLYNSQ